MNAEFMKLVYSWSETELFYKKLYNKKKAGKEEYERFLNTLTKKVLRENYITVPGLFSYEEFDETSPIFDAVSDIAIMKHSRYTPGYFHSHTYFEMIYVVEGKIENRIEGNDPIIMYKGDFCILPDGVKHSVETMGDDDIILNLSLKKSTFQSTFFDILSGDNILSKFFQQALNGGQNYKYLLFRTGDDENIQNCMVNIFLEYYYHRKHYNTILYNYVMVFFALLMRNYEKYFYIQDEHQSDLELVKYLKTNFATVTLESTAEHFGYNPEYLSRLIKKVTGETYSQLMTKYKLDASARLLRESRLNISQICEVVGYNSPEHFNRQFKKEYECTPGEYRLKYLMSN